MIWFVQGSTIKPVADYTGPPTANALCWMPCSCWHLVSRLGGSLVLVMGCSGHWVVLWFWSWVAVAVRILVQCTIPGSPELTLAISLPQG